MAKNVSIRRSIPTLMRVLRHFRPWIREERSLITGSFAALFAGIALRLLEPWPLKFIIDDVLGAGEATTVSDADPGFLITAAALAIVAISAARALVDFTHKVGFAKVGIRVLQKARDHLFRHVQGLSLGFHTKSRSGDLIVRVTRDVSLLRDVFSTALLPLIANVLVLVGMVVVMVVMQWRLALLAAAILPLFWLVTTRLGRGIHEAARKQRRREGAMASTVSESITAIRDVQALSLEDSFAASFSARNTKSQRHDLKATRLSAKLVRVVDVLVAMATALVLWFGTHMALEGELTVGELIVFLTYLRRAFNPAKDLAKYSARLAKAAAAGERVMDVLNTAPAIRDSEDSKDAPEFRGHVVFENVAFSFGGERPVFEGVSFDVPPGSLVTVTGPSGAGKSTLASLLLRLYDPVDGVIRIDGEDIRAYKVASLRRQVGVVLQDSLLFGASITENIAVGRPDAGADEIEAAARLAQAHEFIMRQEDGYDTVIGERGVTLSRGQQQRLAIARAALRRPPLLVLDEPTTGLDTENERVVVEALLALASDRTTFLITHDPDLAKRGDFRLEIRDGRILVTATETTPAHGKGSD